MFYVSMNAQLFFTHHKMSGLQIVVCGYLLVQKFHTIDIIKECRNQAG
jgi:hypothetical protein